MKRKITGFHQDELSDWVAQLECGHGQHVRHNPPWQLRPWVLSEETRHEHLGNNLNCKKCDSGAPKDPWASAEYDQSQS